MKSLSFILHNLATLSTFLGFIFVFAALALTPPGKAQLLMNMAPQALTNSPAGPTYTGTLDAVKQRLNSSATGSIQSKPQQQSTPDTSGGYDPKPSAAMPAKEVCELKLSQMNDIQRQKVVKVNVGRCLMVFNAND